uniref:Uncharacterized protein n=1 Tax=Cucumis melo TaxID=3656 RepID=A0A9I9EC40_CUCME
MVLVGKKKHFSQCGAGLEHKHTTQCLESQWQRNFRVQFIAPNNLRNSTIITQLRGAPWSMSENPSSTVPRFSNAYPLGLAKLKDPLYIL